MAEIKLTDSFGFVDVVQITDKGAINKYFKPLPDTIAVSTLNLKADGKGHLDKVASTKATLDLGTAAQLGTGQTIDLEIKATASGTVSIFSTVGGKPATLFEPDQFADPITVQPNQCYVSTAFNATVEADAGTKVSDLKFGFKASSAVTLSYYQLFDLGQNPPTLADAIESTVSNFAIPGDLDDVEAMPPNSIAVADGTGDLKFSGTLNLLALTNATASVTLSTVGPVSITAGGKLSVGAGFELSSEYQVRIQRLAGKQFHLGLYRKKNSEITLNASASGGLGAGLGQNDLFGDLLKLISKDPDADLKALAALPPAQIAQIQAVIKQAVDRTLNVGVTAEIGFGSEKEAMFLYEIDLDKITEDGRVMVHSALEGDLGPLVSAGTDPDPGIVVLKTLISSAKTLRHSLKVNLLGIYNFARVSELILKGSVATDLTTGQVILTDTATASEIDVSAVNFGADPKKLRHILSEQFLISAAYLVSRVVQGPPGLNAQHSYFELDARTSRIDIRKDLSLGAAFQLISQSDALARLTPGIQDFGLTTVLGEAAYDDAALVKLFLENDKPRDAADYESAGRAAITVLVQKGDEDDFRLIPALDDQLWNQLKQIGDVGSAQFAEAIQAHTKVPIAPNVIGVDFHDIEWWSTAMQSCAKKLLDIRGFIDSHPGLDPNNHDFLARKRDLAKHLKTVANQTRQNFGGPWGLIAMCLLATKVASVKTSLLITNKYVSLDL